MGTFIGDLWDDFSTIPSALLDNLKFVSGPLGTVGIMVFQGAILVGTPQYVIQAVVAVTGPVGEALLPQSRLMSREERTLAHMIYGNTLPKKIWLTNLKGYNGRWFVIPNIYGEILVNVGESYKDPIRHTDASYREFGQILIHELGHAWQIGNIGSPTYVYEAVPPQVTGPEYDPGDGSNAWNDYSIEQQATIVDRWYAGAGPYVSEPCSRGNSYYNHVKDTINAGNEPPVLQTMSVRDIAKRKFDQDGGFSVSSRFPRNNSGSLRNRLIGLKR